jgi:hypothetical protein
VTLPTHIQNLLPLVRRVELHVAEVEPSAGAVDAGLRWADNVDGSGLIGLAQGAVAPKQMDKDAAKSLVLTSSPACPNISTDAVNHDTATEPITVRYDGKAKA